MEPRIYEIGHEFFQTADREQYRWSTRRWVADRFLHFSMRDGPVKTQLFRFVDLLPALRTAPDINAHFREYLGHVRNRLPVPLVGAVAQWPQAGWLGRISAALIRGSVQQLARRFIPATNPDSAAVVARQLRRRGLAFTVDLLGEAVLPEAGALVCQRRYLDLLEQLTTALATLPEVPRLDRDEHGPIPRVNISLKLSGSGTQAGGPDYLSQFVWSRTITENTMRHGFVPTTNSDRLANGGD